MSEILRQSGVSLSRWWPVVLRCLLYFLIALIPEFLKEVQEFWKNGHWAPIQTNTLGIVSGSWSGLVAIRAFLDTFMKTHSDAVAEEKKKETAFFPKPAP